ncbi:DUF4179 domain-containing protein [Oscillibacter valericigenes]|uniref:DUF4179 domain-containing protein n=1 Tax=Oscillibacter valericigenes TaxID=351091 RepID=UPI001F2AE623|nr:DUF4179 domain-containing protein [Oscillibacter valericigenes]MCF2664345.1 DUF4179 domain-containing protein [Oscillibacter valericigenes]
MSRNEEYKNLLAELESVPAELECTVEKAVKRKTALQKKRRAWGISCGSIAACFTAFVLLVNLSVPFARACGSIPVLRELAKAVAWSPSLSAAVENQYVQPIGQSQTVNGITATIEYVIVDQKQLNIFFTLNAPGYDNLNAEMPRYEPEQVCSTIGSSWDQPPGTLLHYTLDYGDHNVPDSFTMTFGVTTYVEPDWSEGPTEAPVRSYEDEMLEPVEAEEPDYLAEFTFALAFDPQFTAKGELIPVNRTFDMDGQSLTVTEVEVYPTHVRVNVADDPSNTAWLKSLAFYLENEDGERFEPISNGVSATGDEDSPAYVSFRLESPYFAHSEHLILHITGAEWLDKDMETVRVDLAHRTAERLPEGVAFQSAEKRDGGWLLTFRVQQREENHSYQVWYATFYDEAGNPYEANRRGTTTDGSGYFEEMLPLPGYQEDVVWLQPTYSRTTAETIPITIPIK